MLFSPLKSCRFRLLVSMTIISSFFNFLVSPAEIKAQSTQAKDDCEYFKEVTTDQIEIRKKIQDTLIAGNNWNTDFAVPAGKKYDFFVAKMTPENSDNYEVSIHLKYANGTSDTVYSRNIVLERDEGYSLTFQSPTSNQPYQVNFRVGGANNNAYTISILGCE